MELLLGAGASIDASNERGQTALMHSLWSEITDASAVVGVVEALLAAGADVAARDNDGDTALHHLSFYSHMQQWAPAAARLLLASGANGRVKNDAGETSAEAVPEAARGGELHRLLLEAAGA